MQDSSLKIVYKPHHKSRSIRVRLTENGDLIITYPVSIPKKRIKQYFSENSERILGEYKKFSTNVTDKMTQLDLSVQPDGYTIQSVQGNTLRIHCFDKRMEIIYTNADDFSNSSFRLEIKETVLKILKKRARVYLKTKLDLFSNKYNLFINKLYIKNQRSRWGSCSTLNNINLNIRLLLLPEELIDYVLLHELVHTLEKNHSKKFWNLLTKMMPDCKQRRKKLSSFTFGFLD
jgi:predicted metal-dependent hydrolase